MCWNGLDGCMNVSTRRNEIESSPKFCFVESNQSLVNEQFNHKFISFCDNRVCMLMARHDTMQPLPIFALIPNVDDREKIAMINDSMTKFSFVSRDFHYYKTSPVLCYVNLLGQSSNIIYKTLSFFSRLKQHWVALLVREHNVNCPYKDDI